jgi:hypothetical protein
MGFALPFLMDSPERFGFADTVVAIARGFFDCGPRAIGVAFRRPSPPSALLSPGDCKGGVGGRIWLAPVKAIG